jgi:hypothetical protein
MLMSEVHEEETELTSFGKGMVHLGTEVAQSPSQKQKHTTQSKQVFSFGSYRQTWNHILPSKSFSDNLLSNPGFPGIYPLYLLWKEQNQK